MESQLVETTMARNRVEHPVWTVPASFCTMQYNNDVRYMSGDEALQNELLLAARQNTKAFNQTSWLGGPKDFQAHLILIAIKALRNIDYGEGLYLYYGC